MDRFLKTCLVLIVLLLSVIAVRVISPNPVQAQGQRKYVAVLYYSGDGTQGHSMQGTLDQYAADGWELVAPSTRAKTLQQGTPESYI
jgi:hypothetical protein